MLSDEDRDAELLEDYRGLLWRRPWLGAIFTAMLLSLAGIPLTAGFVGKFYIVAAGANTQFWFLLAVLVVNSVIGLYYYIKIIAVMFAQPASQMETEAQPMLHPTVYLVSGVTMSILALLLLGIGIYPTFLMETIQGLLVSFK
jgi:NADH-quinone oxidoreductase subunit N